MQEFAKRDMDIWWCCVTGRNVGTYVLASATELRAVAIGGFYRASVYVLMREVWRDRIFMFACKKGRAGEVFKARNVRRFAGLEFCPGGRACK